MAALIDYGLWSTWQQLYDLDAEPELGPVFRPHVRLSYHRAVLMKLARDQAQAYIRVLGWQPTQKIGFVGCGFGWTVEVLQNDHGFTNIVGADTSTFIQTNKGGTEEADINAGIIAIGLSPLVGEGATIKAKLFDGGPRARVPVLNQSGATAQSRAAIKQAAGGNLDIAFTEDVLEAWSDADCQTISTAMHQLAPVVQHLVTTLQGQEVTGNWKTLSSWKALLPNDTFLAAGTYEIL